MRTNVRRIAGLTVMLSLGCSKTEPIADPAPAPPSTVAVASSSPAPSVSGAIAPAAPPSGSASVAVAPVLPSAAPTAPRPLPMPVASAVTTAPSASASAPGPSPAPPKPVATRLTSPAWNIDFSSPGGCTVGAQCSAQLRVDALGAYHVNGEYRFRFVPSAASGIAFTGGAPTDFALQGPKVGVMSVGFQPSAAGTASLAGTFKICVCTDSACQPEQVAVALTVPVAAN